MFWHKVFMRNFSKCTKCHLKETSIRPLNGVPLRLFNSQPALLKRNEIKRLEPFLYPHHIREVSCKRFSSKFSDVKCWKCKQLLELKKLTCSSCGALQYPKQNINYFELFGVSQTFDVDLEVLSKKFKDLQKAFHPDKFVNKSKEELEISEMYSRLVNKAYSTLRDPLARGFYLLDLQKIPAESTFPLEHDFLLGVMEKNEELEGISSEGLLTKFSKLNNEDVEKQINLISHAFSHNMLEDAKMNLLKLNYFINLDNKIKQKKSDFEASKNS